MLSSGTVVNEVTSMDGNSLTMVIAAERIDVAVRVSSEDTVVILGARMSTVAGPPSL